MEELVGCHARPLQQACLGASSPSWQLLLRACRACAAVWVTACSRCRAFCTLAAPASPPTLLLIIHQSRSR